MHWFILLIPFLIAVGAKLIFQYSITWKEMAIQIVGSVFITWAVIACGMYTNMTDTEIWNGKVTDKKKVRVSCEHSYSCNCRTVTHGSGDHRYTTTECDTCYEHSFDNDWRVYSSIEDTLNISRVDRQGLLTPPRWDAVRIGEPFSSEHTYVNYIKAVPESIFNANACSDTDPLLTLVPNYPRVQDYYKVNRVQLMGVPLKDQSLWNDGLNEIAKTYGVSKEANPLVQFVSTNDPKYKFALEKKWTGGKKNDIILVVGTKNYPNIDFIEVVMWENEAVKQYLKNDLKGFQTIDDDFRVAALKSITTQIEKNYKRMSMEDYEYLKDNMEPPTWCLILGIIMALCSGCGLTYFFHKNDVDF